MAEDFASALASRIQSHPEFWVDFGTLQASAARSSISAKTDERPAGNTAAAERIAKLLYAASIFSQTADESNKALAQTIALSSLLLPEADVKLRERTESILADLGNFPAIGFLRQNFKEHISSLLSALRVDILAMMNSVQIGESELRLTDFQYSIWEDLPTAASMSISAPTSGGKSFLLIEYLARRSIKDDKYTAVYVAPTRALLAEIYQKVSTRLQALSDIRISTVPSLDPEQRPKQIFILTQERLHVLLSVSTLVVNTLVVDEAQNIADGARGMILHDCIERLRQINANMQVFFLSPGAEGFDRVARILGFSSIQERNTSLSPVLQNRILVKAVDGETKRLNLALLQRNELIPIGDLPTERGVADPKTRLAAAALELGREGAALVYATGPVHAEEVAAQLASALPAAQSDPLDGLSAFIREHIHPEYGLAAMVLHGISFHYGKMPTLLREAIESSFRSGDLRYLVCTTTLFQGVNLPARSVFINTPTRGKGVSLDPALLWNFAGRAGRLGKELVGNVFLVDYHKWVEQAFNEPAKFNVKSALSQTIEENFEAVLGAINGDMPKLNPRSPVPANVRAAAGLLLSRASGDRASELLDRLGELTAEQKVTINKTAREAVDQIQLPAAVLENNWTVDPYGLKRLATRMRVKIDAGDIEDLIPLHPREDSFSRYAGIFNRTAREILGYKTSAYGGFVATYAVLWMRGVPYPELLGRWIAYHRKKDPQAKINGLVRKAFEFIENVLRFQMVQLGKAYLDVLDYVLEESGLAKRRPEVFDFSLALELGVSTTSGRAFIELGTSRITALALESLFPDSELTPSQARVHIQSLDIEAVGLSPLIVRELQELRLLSA